MPNGASLDTTGARIVLTGQSFLTTDIRLAGADLIPEIGSLLRGDVVFTNFESVIGNADDPDEEVVEHARIVTPPGGLDSLMDLGVNLVALSNNHSFCRGERGLLTTLREAEVRGLAHAGTGRTVDDAARPAYVRADRATVGLVSMASGMLQPGAGATSGSPGVNELRVGPPSAGETSRPDDDDTRRILAAVEEASRSADYVISYHHNHAFDMDFAAMVQGRHPARLVPPPWVRRWARRQIEAGADVVVLHGIPLLHGVEIHRGRPIFYSLGNFIFQSPTAFDHPDFYEPAVWESVVAEVAFSGARFSSVRFQPIAVERSGLPVRATGSRAREILDRLAAISAPFGTEIVVHGDAAELTLT